MRSISRLVVCFCVWLLPVSGAAQDAGSVLLVINTASQASVEIGQYYARRRGIPPQNILALKLDVSDEVPHAYYTSEIEGPISAWIAGHSAHDRILYIVLTKDVPLRIRGTGGRAGTVASVDSELTLSYRKLTGRSVAPAGRVSNPYYLGDMPLAQAKAFSHRQHDIFLVARLDGFSVGDVRGLIDRGVAADQQPGGKIVLDGKAAWQNVGNAWLDRAANALRELGVGNRLVVDLTSTIVDDDTDIMGYYSWGSNDPAIKARRFALGFRPGAVGAQFVSTDARTFHEPPAQWNIGTWESRATYFAGSPQSLTGDLIRAGLTGAAGHVAEPYLDASIRPDILFPAYVSGFNLVEAYYLAMPYLSWQTVVIGDPLCAPFRKAGTAAAADADRDLSIDPVTELPPHFARRRLEVLASAGVRQEAVRLLLRAEARLAKSDKDGARAALEEAARLEPGFTAAQMSLATLAEQVGDHDTAIDRYRRVLATSPNSAVALNNLAYSLAVRRQAASDALPLAERAYALTKGDPNVADTLGWIYHLLGDHSRAAALLAQAVTAAPGSAELRLHAAVAYFAVGQSEAAARELERALELDPAVETHEEAKQLRAKLSATRSLTR